MSHKIKPLITFALIFIMVLSCCSEITIFAVSASDHVDEDVSTEPVDADYEKSSESIGDESDEDEAADTYFEEDLVEDGVEAEEKVAEISGEEVSVDETESALSVEESTKATDESSLYSEPNEAAKELSVDAEPTEQTIETNDKTEQEVAFEAESEATLQTEEMADSLNATTFPEASADELKSSRVNLPFNNGESVYPRWGLEKFDRDANADGKADRDLAVCSLALCNATNNTKNNGDSTEIYKLLRKLGFEDIYLYYQTEDDVVDYPGMTFALYPKTINGKYLITAVFRGTTDSGDVKTDIGAVGNGFLTAGTNCVDELKKYIAIMNSTKGINITRENTILYLSGHSYGGSCAGQVARMAEGYVAYRSSIFAYTFGAPNYDLSGTVYDSEGHHNIYNYVNKKDTVPYMPTKGEKLGYVIEYDINNPSSTGEGLLFKNIYEHYVGVSYDKHAVSLFSIGDIAVISNEHMPYTYLAWILADQNTFSDSGRYNKDSYLGFSSGGGSNSYIDLVEIENAVPESIENFKFNANINLTIRCVLNNRSSDDLSISYNNSKDRLVQLYYAPIEKNLSSSEIKLDVEVSVPAAELVNLSQARKDLVLYANLINAATYKTYTITLPKDVGLDQSAWYEDYFYDINPYGENGMLYGYMLLSGYKGKETDIVIPNSAYYNGRYYPIAINRFANNYDGYSNKMQKLSVQKGVKWHLGDFRDCDTLVEVDLSGMDTSECDGLKNIFEFCSSLEAANLSGWDTSLVGDISGCFFGCESLKNVDMSGWDTSNIENMEGMFVNCKSLETLDLSGYNTSKVTTMKQMFLNCEKLKTINLSGWDVSSLKTVYEMFGNCTSLETINLSGWVAPNLWDMTRMFYGCDSLSVLHTPKKIDYKDKSIPLPKKMSEKNADGTWKTAIYTDLTQAPANTTLYAREDEAKNNNQSASNQSNKEQNKNNSAKAVAQKLTKITPSAKSLTVGQSITLKLSGTNLKGKPVYSTSNKKVATVSSSGKVKAKSAGKATITVYLNKTGNYAKSNTVSCKITVIKSVAVKSVRLNKKTAAIKKGRSVKLTATVAPKNATNKKVTWKSSNKKVATVSSKGVVKGIKKGKATITAITSSGKKKAICKVTVK